MKKFYKDNSKRSIGAIIPLNPADEDFYENTEAAIQATQ